jgi:hypothetical protein
MDSNSGVKLLFKSFLKTNLDEDIVSGFLTAFNHFSLEEFNQSLESIEMGGLRWIYILETNYNLLFVAAGVKSLKTEILMGRLNAIKNAFINEYANIWENRDKSWDGNLNVFLPFLQEIEDYYNQWEEVENLADLADFFDILGVFEQLLIKLGNIIQERMYTKSRNDILGQIKVKFEELKRNSNYCDVSDTESISFSKDTWFHLKDSNLMNCDKELVISFLKKVLIFIVATLVKVKGKDPTLIYFHDEKIFGYLFNNMKLLKDLRIDFFLLELFLLL